MYVLLFPKFEKKIYYDLKASKVLPLLVQRYILIDLLKTLILFLVLQFLVWFNSNFSVMLSNTIMAHATFVFEKFHQIFS
jgi:hypothetical protein